MQTTIIAKLIDEGKRGTEDLYSKIPFFLRSRLDAVAISDKPWARVKEGCEQRDQECLENAQMMYSNIFKQADEYIKVAIQRSQNDINSTLMMLDKHRLINEFQDDSVRFVTEMAKCLEKEKELIFTYSECELTEGERSDDNDSITEHMEDKDLKIIEELALHVDYQLQQIRKNILERIKCLNLPQELLENVQVPLGQDVNEMSLEMFRPIYSEIESIEWDNEQRTTQITMLKEKTVQDLSELNTKCLLYVSHLNQVIKDWKAAEAKKSVKVGPDPNTAYLTSKFKKFGELLNTMLLWFSVEGHLHVIRNVEVSTKEGQMSFLMEVGKMENNLQFIMQEFLKIVLIVSQQPKGAISIENKGKKDAPNYCTKKTQPFSTAVRVLAGESFKNFEIISKDTGIDLVAEKDLAQSSFAPVTGRGGQPCLKVETTIGTSLPDIQFNIEVKNFHRVEQNNVYKQFFRFIYRVKVSINGTEYHLQTMSLPFTFNTGANQILEHMGARMWYCASVDDLYNDNFQCPDPLPVDKVISILDNRIANLGSKTRRLTESEKVFLRGRLPVASDGTVTMQGFIKDKMRKLRSDEPLAFSFYTWFYAVTHSIEQLLLSAWQDGIIYGFCSEKTAEEILMSKKVPEGTFILRPSVSEIKKTSSTDATAALAMEVKMRKEDAHPFDGHDSEFQVISIPLMFKHIEKNTLYGAIRGIMLNEKPVAKFLYGRDGGGKKLDVLKGYVKKKQEQHYPEYRVLVEKIEQLKVKPFSQQRQGATASSDGDDDSERESNRRKRKHRNSSASTQSQLFSQSSPMTSGMGDSCGSLPAFSMMSRSNFSAMGSPSNSTVDDQSQGHRPTTQVKELPGLLDMNIANGTFGQQPNEIKSEIPFGDVIVDLSQLNTVLGQLNHGDQSLAQMSTVTSDSYSGSLESTASNACFTVVVSPDLDSRAHSSIQGGSPFRSISVSPESSLSSQGSSRASPPQFVAMKSPNLPTVLNDPIEPKKAHRSRGGAGGNGGNARLNKKKSGNSSSQEAQLHARASNTEHPLMQLQNDSVRQNNIFDHIEPMIDGDIVTVFTLPNSFSMEPSQLAACIQEQRAALQMSPDSGMGDQSPSPISTFDTYPFPAVFQGDSVIVGQDSMM